LDETNVKIWLEIAQDDLSTAELCYKGKKNLWAMVLCQQAIEKILKALYVKQNNQIPEKTHILKKLASDTKIIDKCDKETLTFFNDLVIFYFGTRYPDKREKLLQECTEAYIKMSLEKTKEVFKWIKEML
jgi:HEPN domain-containing protein